MGLCVCVCVCSSSKSSYCFLFLTRRGLGVRITDLAETLGYVFGYRNMKKAVILEPNAQKN